MFRRPVQRCTVGDRVGICVSQLDPKTIERGLACTPGSVPTFSAAIAAVEKIRFFQGVRWLAAELSFPLFLEEFNDLISRCFIVMFAALWSTDRVNLYSKPLRLDLGCIIIQRTIYHTARLLYKRCCLIYSQIIDHVDVLCCPTEKKPLKTNLNLEKHLKICCKRHLGTSRSS